MILADSKRELFTTTRLFSKDRLKILGKRVRGYSHEVLEYLTHSNGEWLRLCYNIGEDAERINLVFWTVQEALQALVGRPILGGPWVVGCVWVPSLRLPVR